MVGRLFPVFEIGEFFNVNEETFKKAKDKKYKQDDDVFFICESTIVEDNDNQSGDDAIFCEGLRQGWLHCKCAGMINVCVCFDKLSNSNKFLCVYCQLFQYISLVVELREQINQLKSKLTETSPVQTKLGSQTTISESSTLDNPTLY